MTGPYVNILGCEPMAYGAFEHGETNGRTSGSSGGGPAVASPARPGVPMEAFLMSLSTVAIAEMGDRTVLKAMGERGAIIRTMTNR